MWTVAVKQAVFSQEGVGQANKSLPESYNGPAEGAVSEAGVPFSINCKDDLKVGIA